MRRYIEMEKERGLNVVNKDSRMEKRYYLIRTQVKKNKNKVVKQ